MGRTRSEARASLPMPRRARPISPVTAAAAALVVQALTQYAWADAAAIERGRQLAEAHCGRCHAIGSAGESPQRRVIPFRDLHQRAPLDMLDDARKTGVVAGHDEMPMFEIGPRDANNLRTYIESLWPLDARGPRRP